MSHCQLLYPSVNFFIVLYEEVLSFKGLVWRETVRGLSESYALCYNVLVSIKSTGKNPRLTLEH